MQYSPPPQAHFWTAAWQAVVPVRPMVHMQVRLNGRSIMALRGHMTTAQSSQIKVDSLLMTVWGSESGSVIWICSHNMYKAEDYHFKASFNKEMSSAVRNYHDRDLGLLVLAKDDLKFEWLMHK